MSVTGFDFQNFNQKYLQAPANDAIRYGASIVPVPASRTAWRCIGIYHLRPDENRGRHNIFIDVLDEAGNRVQTPTIRWTWWIDGPQQTTHLDKPLTEPACDIPLESKATVTLFVDGDGLPSDRVGNLHTRHADEGEGNTWMHHSYYVVFQCKPAGVIIAPPPIDTELDRLRAENARLRAAVLSSLALLEDVVR